MQFSHYVYVEDGEIVDVDIHLYLSRVSTVFINMKELTFMLAAGVFLLSSMELRVHEHHYIPDRSGKVLNQKHLTLPKITLMNQSIQTNPDSKGRSTPYSEYVDHNAWTRNLSNCKPLNSFITCFEEINFEGDDMWTKPQTMNTDLHSLNKGRILRRNSGHDALEGNDHILDVEFTAFAKEYKLRLISVPKPGIISDAINVTVVSANGTSLNETYYKEDLHCYHGYVAGEHVTTHGSFKSGVFDGVVRITQGVSLFIEPASRYFVNRRYYNISNIAVVYRTSAISSVSSFRRHSKNKKLWKLQKMVIPSTKEYESATAAWNASEFSYGIPTTVLAQDHKICELHAVIDHTFFEVHGNNNVEDTVNRIVYYVTEADEIFRATDFNGDEIGDNIGFKIAAISIYANASGETYWISNNSLDADSVLERFSLYTFDSYCLGILFTSRDYDDETIGLAWMATSSRQSSPGGICQKRYYDGEDFLSLNTAMITTCNNGNEMPHPLNSLTLAHEIGHSFGSPHDKLKRQRCTPGGGLGNYLMSDYSTSASEPNNWIFSPCSLDFINDVIEKKGTCLIVEKGPICGNRLVEKGEQCDCGGVIFCEKESRCTPPSTSGSGCTLENKDCEAVSGCNYWYILVIAAVVLAFCTAGFLQCCM